MLLFDMPRDQLFKYEGRNECPEDIDEYWDRAVAEMEALGTDYKLQPAKVQFPNVECYELWYTGVGGALIHGRLARPAKRDGKLPAVARFHGYWGNCGDFFNLLPFVAAGCIAAGIDCRGQAGTSEDIIPVKGTTLNGHIIRGLSDPNPDKLYYRSVFLDAAQLARILMAMEDVDETRVGATGGSQGGGLTLACAALTPALNRAAPWMPFLCDYRRIWEIEMDRDAYAELHDYFRCFDPRHEHEKEIFTRLGYIDNQHLAHRIRAEVKMFTGLSDTICPPSTQFAAYNKINSKKNIYLYPDYGHEDMPEMMDMIVQFIGDMRA